MHPLQYIPIGLVNISDSFQVIKTRSVGMDPAEAGKRSYAMLDESAMAAHLKRVAFN